MVRAANHEDTGDGQDDDDGQADPPLGQDAEEGQADHDDRDVRAVGEDLPKVEPDLLLAS